MINTILTTLLWLFGITILGLGGFLTMDELKFKHRAIVIEKNNGTKLKRIIRSKEFKDADGSVWWKIKGFKDPVPRPENKYISVNEKGRYVATFYQLNGGELHPTYENDIEMDENSTEFIAKIQPLKTSQRQILVNQQLKVQRQKGKNLAEILTYAIPFFTLIVIIAIVMIFADEAMQPMIELGKTNGQVVDKLDDLVQKMDTVINNRVYINDIETTGGVYNNTPPPN